MAETDGAAGTLRDNMAALYQSGQRPTRGEDAAQRPVDPTTGRPQEPRLQPGYYPGYQTLSQQAFWDEATRKVVLDRVQNVPAIRFFRPDEVPLLQAVIDRLLPQTDRVPARRIPILPRIDQRLHDGVMDGYRYEGMPPDDEAIRRGLQGIQQMAREAFDKDFQDLPPSLQDQILLSLHDGEPAGAKEVWEQLPVLHFWQLLLQDCIEAYYAHPYAWDEIGFGGPAYPRGYMRLDDGEPEPWEQEERRYDWAPPPAALSGAFSPVGRKAGPHTPTPGQEGTH